MPRISGIDGKGVGTQPVITTADTLSWQCHIVDNRYRSRYKTIIAVESYSRYTLLIPCPHRLTQTELEFILLNSWLRDLIDWMEETGAESKAVIGQACETMDATDFNVQWVRNMDLSINGHVIDASYWLRDVLEQEGVDSLSDELAYLLGRHINQQFKRAKSKAGGTRRFCPVERLLEDGLIRFVGDSSNLLSDTDNLTRKKRSDNVVCIEEFRQKKSV